MRIVQINTFSYKATGAIMLSIHQALLDSSIQSYVVWGRGRKAETNNNEFSIIQPVGTLWHGLYSRFFDKTGFASKKATKELIKFLDSVKPDILHLHNLHGYYINIEMLFNYIKNNNIKIVWTFHDCWPFTGHCAYFDMIGCNKWKNGCNHCTQLNTYPKAVLFDNSFCNWQTKKKLFAGLNLTIVTPSQWLANLVRESFFKSYGSIKVIHNGINQEIFMRTKTDFKSKIGIEDKYVVLGVAHEWTERKGLKDFLILQNFLQKIVPEKYRIVLVGLSKKQIAKLPEAIIGIEKTSNVQELVNLYSAADLFFNPTYEDNYPTTNLEALSCGTPVVTYATGGSPETIPTGQGIVLEQGNVKACAEIIIDRILSKQAWSVNAHCKEIGVEKMTQAYLQLYQEVTKEA